MMSEPAGVELSPTRAELSADGTHVVPPWEPAFGCTPASATLPPPVTREWSAECALTPRAVRLARTRARTCLTVLGWAGDVDDAVLVVSELVTNAVRHARVPGRVAWLRLALLEDGALLVDVSDPVEGFRPSGDGCDGGRGLQLVRSLGELSWFLRSDPDRGKTVRARLCP
ncbi:ATP-binding protein [Streptomyces sp. NPDC087440]|uniref:ATP-binding protein n=1 Tax=Streptomyces sp. NPDC087440 TaxID=3365790 RepID=UPI003814AE90